MKSYLTIGATLLLYASKVLVATSVFDASQAGNTCDIIVNKKPLIAGNWKMNTDLSSATKLTADLLTLSKDMSFLEVEIALFPPFPFIRDVWKVRFEPNRSADRLIILILRDILFNYADC